MPISWANNLWQFVCFLSWSEHKWLLHIMKKTCYQTINDIFRVKKVGQIISIGGHKSPLLFSRAIGLEHWIIDRNVCLKSRAYSYMGISYSAERDIDCNWRFKRDERRRSDEDESSSNEECAGQHNPFRLRLTIADETPERRSEGVHSTFDDEHHSHHNRCQIELYRKYWIQYHSSISKILLNALSPNKKENMLEW